MKNIAVVFAGGVGARMGSNIPKQFLEIYGKPILIHTLEKFQYNYNIDEIYLGCKKEYIPYVLDLIKKYNLTKVSPKHIIPGGKTGLNTIHKLLLEINNENDDAVVLIHDGVRPNITNRVINDNIKSVLKYGNGITCTKTNETSIISNDGKIIDDYLERDRVFTAKAPQSFMLKEILTCYNKVLEEHGTFSVNGIVDSCSIALNAGLELNIVEGNGDNVKVTTPNDYIDILSRLIATDYSNFFEIESQRKFNDIQRKVLIKNEEKKKS